MPEIDEKKKKLDEFQAAVSIVLEYLADIVKSRVLSELDGVSKQLGDNGPKPSEEPPKEGKRTGQDPKPDGDDDINDEKQLKSKILDLVNEIGKKKAYAVLESKDAFYSKNSTITQLKRTLSILRAVQGEGGDDGGDDPPF